MVFHLGSLWRLNELGLLPSVSRISSVSGGSLTSAWLACSWDELTFDDAGVATNFREKVTEPILGLAKRTIDVPSGLLGMLMPFMSIHDAVAGAYARDLFGDRTLQDFPDESHAPRFILNATDVHNGVLWRFCKAYMADYLVGRENAPAVPVAKAVACSSAFPPFLSPALLPVDAERFAFEDSSPIGAPKRVALTDGGVYDNLGLETVWKNYTVILASDAGGPYPVKRKPKRDWIRHAARIMVVMNEEITSLRKHQLIDALEKGERIGAYWGLSSQQRNYGLDDAVDFPAAFAAELSRTPTRLAKLDERTRHGLVDWGYAIADTALRRHFMPGAPKPDALPFG